ncbi:uncharacterized protein LOC113359346 [Papaver somniferum]|uniref:uncharacterized protein LOC113359346 n=1 Tax=Papaver somniferum TaxID=3469 RepID=UPI000E6F9376|nr:uncharacterized protein LOC113359346 [Papaver somniferum]
MMNDYFTPGNGYTSRQFKQRLSMREELFEKLLGKLLEVDPEWHQHPDATGTMGHYPYMKLVVVMKCLCKSMAADSVEDYTRMRATTIYYYLKRFCHTVCITFGERYLHEPTSGDVQRFLAKNTERVFPGMLGSIDCMQWSWKNCPIAWQGTYQGKEKHSSMGVAPSYNYVVNGHQYHMSYFLVDGTYPKLTTIVQAFSQTLDIPEYVRFNKYQMTKRKDVEHAFGVLQDLVKHIVARPGRGGQAGDFSSLEGSDMEYVVLPSSDEDYDDTYLEEEVVPGQNEDGAFDYYGDYNDQIPDDFEHADEHVYADGHVEDEYEHDGDDHEDDDDDEDEDEDAYDDT